MTKPALKPNDPAGILPRLPQGAEILIVRLRSLGDMVMLTPALAALHAWRPDLRVNVLVEPAFAAVLAGNPAVAQIILYRDFFSASVELRSKGFPVIFNQHAGPTSALLTVAIGAPLRVCWAERQFSFVYNVLAPPPEHFYGPRKVHTVEHRMTQFYWCGLPPGPIAKPQVFPLDASREAARIILIKHGIDVSRPYAVIHPGASAPEKRWPVEKFADVARWLGNRGVQPIVILGPGDGAIQAEVKQRMGHAILAPLDAVIALIAGARLFVGNDSGPAHLATATGCPPVVIFGATDSDVWRPWQVVHRVVENPTRDISAISVDEVQRACEELLL